MFFGFLLLPLFVIIQVLVTLGLPFIQLACQARLFLSTLLHRIWLSAGLLCDFWLALCFGCALRFSFALSFFFCFLYWAPLFCFNTFFLFFFLCTCCSTLCVILVIGSRSCDLAGVT